MSATLATPAFPARFLARPAVKLVLIGGLLLLMLVPNVWVSAVISEREQRQADVQAEIGRSWGPPQSVMGPILIVPYRGLEPQPAVNGQPQPPLAFRHYAHIVPNRLAVRARLTPEQRRRGLFGAVVYGAELQLEGSFTVPPVTIAGHPEAELLWNEAFVAAGASDLRNAASDTALRWAGQPLTPADESVDGGCAEMGFLRWNLPPASAQPGRTVEFSTALTLRGTQGFHLVPAARQATMTVEAPWPTPSFNGVVLPDRSTVTDRGFQAEWQDGGGARQAVWFSSRSMACLGPAAAARTPDQQFGVDLLEAVPTYRMVTRAAKYAVLFLALSYLTYFLIEMLSHVRIHLMQYGLLGFSISLFALLLLALAEPLGFGLAYALATVAVVAQASLYTWAVTRRMRLACIFAGVLTLLFGFLYGVLSLESYALLAGTLALFVALSVVMAVTIRVNWSGERVEAA